MKKLLLLIMLAALYTGAFSQQQIKIVSFTVKNQLPAVIDNWNTVPGSLLLVAQMPPGLRIDGLRLMIQIKANGAVVCSNNSAGGLPVDNFTTRTFSANELTGSLAACVNLKEGSYTICAQFFSGDRKEASNQVCKEFRVETAKETDYVPPALITPDNDKPFTEAELSRPVTFRWTPLVPKPTTPVTYRLKVWQLMQGQNGNSAMRTNQPIATKDVDNITQAVVTGLYTGPCHPPYLCEFIWQVQALNKEGKPMGRNEGKSEPYSFKVEEKTTAASLRNNFPEDKKQFTTVEAGKPITFRWTPVTPKPPTPVTYRLRVWQLMQGQNSTSAMRTNQPIATKDVDNITEATISNIWTGPCHPPYLCEFVWAVEATTKNSTGASQVIATSDATTFEVKEGNAASISNTFPEDKKSFTPDEAGKPMSFRWTPLVPRPKEKVTYKLRVWQLMQGQSSTGAMRTNQPIITKEVDNITEAALGGIYTGPCKPPMICSYVWVVEATTKNASGASQVIASSEPTTFNVNESSGAAGINNTFPEDNKELPKAEASAVTFRWTPLVPKPKEPVSYRLRVWQLMQGQSSTGAMRSNQPIITKDVGNVTEATPGGPYTGPCKPPMICSYVWMVEAITRNSKGATQVIASSDPTVFKILDDNINTKIDSVHVGCCINGKQTIYVKVGNLHPTNQAQVTAIRYRVNGTGPLTTLSPTVPPIPFTINANSSQAFTGSINCVDSMKTIKFIVETIWPTDPDNINNETAWDTLHCRCDACDEKNFSLKAPPPGNINISNNSISFNQPITVTTTPAKTIKTIKAELVYFEMIPESEMCIPCNKDAATYGHFTNGTNSQEWNGPQQNINISITTPQLTPCCSAVFRWCIRYKIEFTDCTSCNKLVCYEKKKDGCEKAGGIDNPNNPK